MKNEEILETKWMVPNSINKELTQKPSKFFSKSSVVFNDELSVQPTGTPTTREEIRASLGTQNIEHILDGLGFLEIGDDFIIF